MKTSHFLKILAVLAVMILLTVLISWSLTPSYGRILNINWGVKLPVDSICTEIYTKNDPAEFHGPGLRYHIYSYKHESHIAQMPVWQGENEEGKSPEDCCRFSGELLDELDIPREHCPSEDLSSLRFHYDADHDGSELLMVWDQERDLIYVLEHIL